MATPAPDGKPYGRGRGGTRRPGGIMLRTVRAGVRPPPVIRTPP